MSSAANPRSHGWRIPSLEEMQAELPAFRFVQLLGRGGMGAVYQAEELSLGRAVAIKILPADLMEDAEAFFAERFEQEARTMARLNHPGVVRVFDTGRTAGGLLYFVMEYVDGTDLARLISDGGKLAPERVLDVAEQICRALDAAHREGIIHRDIKPANILLMRDGQVKIADFGLAKHHDTAALSLTKTNVAIGTPDYVAPEAWMPGEVLDGRADLFAAGVVLYQMLTGVVPRGLWNPASEVAGTDLRFDAIIDKAMQPGRDSRYATAADMLADLTAIRSGPEVAAPVAPARRRRWIAASAVVLAAAGAVIAGVVIFRMPEKPAPLSTHVTGTGDSGPGSLRQAMENCDENPGPDAITFDPSLAGRTITITGRPPRQKSESFYQSGDAISIDASGLPGGVIVSAAQGFFFAANDRITIRGLTFTGCTADERNMIGNFGHLILADCVFTGNDVSRSGGAIFNLNTGIVELERCTLTGNRTGAAGGVIHNLGTLTLTDCVITGNKAASGGGAIANENGTTTLTRCLISENEAGVRGGAITVLQGRVTLRDCTISDCRVTGTTASVHGGGGIFLTEPAIVKLDHCIVAQNSAASGIGPDLWVQAGTLEAAQSLIGDAKNTALTHGVNGILAGTTAAPLTTKDAPADMGCRTVKQRD